jgi:hypothetical protein
MSGEWLYGTNQLLISAVLMALLVLAAQVGYRTGAKPAFTMSDVGKSHLSTIFGGILGLLALLLGFTFAMSLSRYEHRKQLVTQEANALGTAYLRSQLLPEPEKKEVPTCCGNTSTSGLSFSRLGSTNQDWKTSAPRPNTCRTRSGHDYPQH